MCMLMGLLLDTYKYESLNLCFPCIHEIQGTHKFSLSDGGFLKELSIVRLSIIVCLQWQSHLIFSLYMFSVIKKKIRKKCPL